MYIFDTNVFTAIGHFYPSRFPTIWAKIDELALNGSLRSVKEVRREIETNCPFEHIEKWVKNHHDIFLIPTDEEAEFIAKIFQKERYRGLVKRKNILVGWPTADPFVIAAAKIHNRCVVTQESPTRIPTVCNELQIKCIDLEKFLEQEQLKY